MRRARALVRAVVLAVGALALLGLLMLAAFEWSGWLALGLPVLLLEALYRLHGAALALVGFVEWLVRAVRAGVERGRS